MRVSPDVYMRRTVKALSSMKLSARDLQWLSKLLGRLEDEKFQAPRLQELTGEMEAGRRFGVGQPAPARRGWWTGWTRETMPFSQ